MFKTIEVTQFAIQSKLNEIKQNQGKTMEQTGNIEKD
jgi:hypothetical protein